MQVTEGALDLAGIDNVVLERQTQEYVLARIRAGKGVQISRRRCGSKSLCAFGNEVEQFSVGA